MGRACLLLTSIIFSFPLFGQEEIIANSDNRRCIWISGSEIDLSAEETDGYRIEPASFFLANKPDTLTSFFYDKENGKLTIPDWSGSKDSVQLCYRVVKFNSQKIANRSLNEYDSTAFFKEHGNKLFVPSKREALLETGNVNTAGRLSRGFTIGTNQDMFVNSILNLSLDGQLAENLFIQATITDNTIPYQPEGNTAQLQDFDNVFMRLYNDKFTLTGGDIILRNNPSRFLRYYKNVQGVLFQKESGRSKTQIGVSVAKGKFASVQIASIEGTLGPYRIPAPEGKSFVVVLANSERIFLNGRLLKRGFDFDYTIDYNLGEVSFTSNIIITKFSRINVDYEYADNQYARTALTTSHYQDVGKGKVFVNVYSENDNKNQPTGDLSLEDKIRLSEVGDDLQMAIRSGADSIGFDPARILYRKVMIDSLEVFVHSTHPDSAHWDVKFTKTGPNTGHYIQKITTSNGRVYEWVQPLDGTPQGDHVPYTRIPAPSKKQMINVGASHPVNRYESIAAEVSLSNHDKNTFSDLDQDDNVGKALNIKLQSQGRNLGKSKYEFVGFTELELLDKYFEPIDRFRSVEFERDWSNIHVSTLNPIPFNDLLFSAGIGGRKDAFNLLDYRFSRRTKGVYVDGYQNSLSLNQEFGPTRILSTLFTSSNDIRGRHSSWKKVNTDLSINIKTFRPGYRIRIEENINSQNDSITYSADYFTEHMLYLRSPDSKKSFFDLSYSLREDKMPFLGEIVEGNKSQTTNLLYRNQINEAQNIQLVLTHRVLENKGQGVDFGSGQNLNGRLDWNGHFFKNLFKNDLTYSIGTGRDLKKTYVFIEVPTGQGSHTWIDANEDGIQDLNEFLMAVNLDERNFAKIFIPSNEYIDAYENTFNYWLNLRFPSSWRKGGGVKTLLSKLSNSTAWTSMSRITDESISSRLFAFAMKLNRNDILSMKENFRTTWFFNRGNPTYGLNTGFVQNRILNLLTGGFEDRLNKEFNFTGRFNVGRPYSLKLYASKGKEYSESDFLSNRNFIIDANIIRPSFSWQPKSNFRTNIIYGIRHRNNILDPEQGERAVINELSGEVKVSNVGKTNLQGLLTFSNVDFSGNASSPAGYSVLAGLKPGLNLNWSVNWQQTLINGLQMSVNYVGRKSELSRVIHFGSVTVNALF